jgi:hypothetical protein
MYGHTLTVCNAGTEMAHDEEKKKKRKCRRDTNRHTNSHTLNI